MDAPKTKKGKLQENSAAMADGDHVSRSSGLPNQHLSDLPSDFLYHIGYSSGDDLKAIFGDVKFVVAGGSIGRMGGFAEFIAHEIGHPTVEREQLNIAKTDRFAFYKIGPVLSISHGMGVPSVTIMLHEMIKLLHYAGASDAVIIRIGTSGGLGVEAGTIVVTNKAFNHFLEQKHVTVILGERVSRDALLDQELCSEIVGCQNDSSFQTISSGTMCTDDFYEGQGRLDGFVCEYTEQDKMAYLRKVRAAGVSNIEMECTAMASLCHKANVKCAIICVALLDRLRGDQVLITDEEYKQFQKRPQALVARFIKKRLGL